MKHKPAHKKKAKAQPDHLIHIDFDQNDNAWFVCRHDEPHGKAKHVIAWDTNITDPTVQVQVQFQDPSVVVDTQPIDVPGSATIADHPKPHTEYFYDVLVNGTVVPAGRGAPGIIIE